GQAPGLVRPPRRRGPARSDVEAARWHGRRNQAEGGGQGRPGREGLGNHYYGPHAERKHHTTARDSDVDPAFRHPGNHHPRPAPSPGTLTRRKSEVADDPATANSFFSTSAWRRRRADGRGTQ